MPAVSHLDWLQPEQLLDNDETCEPSGTGCHCVNHVPSPAKFLSTLHYGEKERLLLRLLLLLLLLLFLYLWHSPRELWNWN